MLDPVDLHDGLVAGAPAAANDEGGGHDHTHCDCGDHGFVLDGGFGLVDGVDELAGFCLQVFPTECQLKSSIR